MVNRYLKPVIQTPSSLLITAITRALKAVLTVSVGNSSTEANVYTVGMLIKLFVPVEYGMWQANGLFATITAISSSNITVNVDSTNFDAFSVPVISVSPASISFAGSVNLQYTNGTDLTVPFQSHNNIGN